ncbi:MAG: hypothetical protein WC197_07130 [Candidatus Gastranaerophilaceae bacterium]
MEEQTIVAQMKAQETQQDQVIYKSTDSERYEIFLIAPKESFTGTAFRVVRYTGEDKHETVLQDSGNEQPKIVSIRPIAAKKVTRRTDK